MNVVITGSTKGIGWAIAELLAKNGCNILIHGRNIEDLKSKKQHLQQRFPDQVFHALRADLSLVSETQSFIQDVKNTWDHIDVLINNAGVFLPGKIVEEEEGTLEKQIETNLYSAYRITRGLIDRVRKGTNRHIFNMCSIASQIAYPNGGSYSISKFALLGFSKVLREELKEEGIKVTSILPGATWSNSWAGVDLPHERLMEANDIAIAVWSAIQMSPAAVVEEIVLRPQLGDL